MAKFPVFSLPLVAAQEVFQKLELMDFFNLSFTSSRMLELLRRLNYKTREIEFEYRTDVASFIIKSKYGIHKRHIKFQIDSDEHIQWGGRKFVKKEFKIGIHTFYEQPHDYYTIFNHHNHQFAAIILFKYLFSLFSGPVSLNFEMSGIRNIHAFLIHEEFQRCDELRITQRYEVDAIGFDRLDLDDLLDEVKVAKRLDVFTDSMNSMSIEKIAHTTSIKFYDASWLTLSDLFSLKCKHISLDDNNFTFTDALNFSKHWLNGGNPDLEHLRFYWDEEEKKSLPNWGGVEGLPLKQWDGKRRPQFYRAFGEHDKMNCEDGMDIIRADGRIATIGFLKAFDNSVHFIVWTDEQMKMGSKYEEI